MYLHLHLHLHLLKALPLFRQASASFCGKRTTNAAIVGAFQRRRSITRQFTQASAALNKRIMGDIPPELSSFPLTDVDRWVLSQTDEEFVSHDWEELKTIVGKKDYDSILMYRLFGLFISTNTDSNQQPGCFQAKTFRSSPIY